MLCTLLPFLTPYESDHGRSKHIDLENFLTALHKKDKETLILSILPQALNSKATILRENILRLILQTEQTGLLAKAQCAIRPNDVDVTAGHPLPKGSHLFIINSLMEQKHLDKAASHVLVVLSSSFYENSFEGEFNELGIEGMLFSDVQGSSKRLADFIQKVKNARAYTLQEARLYALKAVDCAQQLVKTNKQFSSLEKQAAKLLKRIDNVIRLQDEVRAKLRLVTKLMNSKLNGKNTELLTKVTCYLEMLIEYLGYNINIPKPTLR